MLLRIFVFLSILLTPTISLAQSGPDDGNRNSIDTFGEIVNNIISPNNTQSVSSLMIALFALIGLVNVAIGLRKLVDWSDGKNGTGLSAGVYRILGGGVLIALPIAVATLLQTFFASDDAATIGSGEIDEVTSANNISEMYINFVKNAADPLTKASLIFAILLGLYLIGLGIMRLIESSNPSSPHANRTGSHIGKIVIGTLLVNLQTLIAIFSSTVFSTGQVNAAWSNANIATESILSRRNTAGGGSDTSALVNQYCNIETYLYIGLIPFGVIAVIIGLRTIYLSLEGGQQASAAGGWVKLIAGIILVNMELFAAATINTFAPSSDYIQSVCG